MKIELSCGKGSSPGDDRVVIRKLDGKDDQFDIVLIAERLSNPEGVFFLIKRMLAFLGWGEHKGSFVKTAERARVILSRRQRVKK